MKETKKKTVLYRGKLCRPPLRQRFPSDAGPGTRGEDGACQKEAETPFFSLGSTLGTLLHSSPPILEGLGSYRGPPLCFLTAQH